MKLFKVRFTKSIAHTYCTVFVAQEDNTTWANCGKLTVRNDEFMDFRMTMPEVPFEEKIDHYDPDRPGHSVSTSGDD